MEKHIRRLLEMYVKASERYETVYAVESAAFADAFVLKNHIDLVLMDILMADGSNGLETAARIKKNCPDVKIIAVTSMPETSWLKRARQDIRQKSEPSSASTVQAV